MVAILIVYYFRRVLFMRGVTLPRAETGIAFYLYPDFSKMGHVKVGVGFRLSVT